MKPTKIPINEMKKSWNEEKKCLDEFFLKEYGWGPVTKEELEETKKEVLKEISENHNKTLDFKKLYEEHKKFIKLLENDN